MDSEKIWKWVPRILLAAGTFSAVTYGWYEFRGEVNDIGSQTEDIESGIEQVVTKSEDLETGIGNVVSSVDESARSTNENLDTLAESTENIYDFLQGVTVQPGFGVPGEAALMADRVGQPMYCFGKYDAQDFVAAVVDSQLPFLPCGTVLRVQNLEVVDEHGNYLETRLKVADKFPEDSRNEHRIVLLSGAAAEEIGLSREKGVVRVLVTVYAQAPETQR